MIKNTEQMQKEIRENMRGGGGSVEILHWFQPGEYNGKARLLAKITLREGCGIGTHTHDGEEEIFYIIKGTGVYDDNGVVKAVTAGDVTITKDGASHSIKNESTEDLLFVAVILTY